MKRPQCRIAGSDRTSAADAQAACRWCDPANCAWRKRCECPCVARHRRRRRLRISPYVTHYSHPRRIGRMFFEAHTGEGKKVDAAAASSEAFEYGAPQIALLRDTLWHFYGPCRRAFEREKPFVLRVPCASIAAVNRESAGIFFHFCATRAGTRGASRRFSRMREQICGRNTCIVH